MSPSISSAVSPVNYRIIRSVLLSKKPFYQLDLSKEASASPSQVSRVIRWLMMRGHVERLPDARYQVRNAVGVIAGMVAYQRNMDEARVASFHLRGKKKAIIETLVKAGGILCLESALEEYSAYFRPDRICIYHEEPEELIDRLIPLEGGMLPVVVFYPDIALDGDVEKNRRTTKFRTVVDITCDDKFYAAKDLLEDLWGIIVE